MITETEVNKAYAKLAISKKAFLVAADNLEMEKYDLEKAITQAHHNGLIEGKNAEQRKGHTFILFETKYEHLETFTATYGEKREAFELAQIEVSRVRAIIRVNELVANNQ